MAIQKISKKEDIKDALTGDIDKIKSIKYYTSTDPSMSITPVTERQNDVLVCYLASQSLETLPQGQLIFECEFEEDDSHFPDGKYNNILIQNLDVWLQ